MRRYITDIFHIIIFVLFVGVFFYQVFLGKLPVPSDALVGLYHPWRDYFAEVYPRGVPFKNFLITDPVRQQIPWRKIAIDQWKQGSIPWWNTYSFSGAPLAGNIQAAAFYPFNILFFFFSFPMAWSLLIVLQPMLAGIFLYVYLRHLQIRPVASLFGAICWSFSGFSIAWLTWGTMMQTALWLPLTLFGIDTVLTGKRSWWFIVGIGLVMQLLAGHAQIALYTVFFCFVYAFVKLRHLKKHPPWLIRDGIALTVGVALLTAVQWVPFIKLALTSSRLVETNWTDAGFFLPWSNLIQFIVPDFFGNPATLNYWGTWNWAEFVGYIGIAPIMFAVVVSYNHWKEVKLWVWTIIVALIFVLPTPLAKLPYWLHIPILSSLQPTRLMVLIDFSLAILAAYGINMMLIKPHRFARIPLGVIGCVFIFLWTVAFIVIHNQVAQRNLILPTMFFILAALLYGVGVRWAKVRVLAVVAILFVTVFDVFRFGWKFTPFTSYEYFFPETAVTRFLNDQPKPFRIMSLDDRLIPPNVAAYFGIETIEGYDPLYSGRYEEFFASVARGSTNIDPPYGFNRILTSKNIESSFLPFTGVTYVLSLEDKKSPLLTKIFQEGETRVYRYAMALPRVYIAEQVTVALSSQDILDQLMKRDTAHIAVLETSVPILTLPLGTNESVKIVSSRPSELTLEAKVSNPRFIVIHNQFDSGWKAEIDGVVTQVYRTNYAFQGVVVPPGAHVVRLYYDFTHGILF